MSLEFQAGRVASARGAGALNSLRAAWTYALPEKAIRPLLIVVLTLFATYVALCVKAQLTGTTNYQFGDFYALWTSAVVTHGGEPALNYDPEALHLRQVAFGMNPHGYNPFPYPPMLLLLLAPLGALGLAAGYVLFISTSFVAYLVAMAAGRWTNPRWWIGACIAPATGVTIVSGQSGFLSAALLVGGLRLAPTRPILAGVLFGLLAYKPQLGVLVPVALLAAGLWRTIGAAIGAVVLCAIGSSVAFGWDIWPIWLHSIVAYAGKFDLVYELMPTISANAHMLGLSGPLALALQLCVSIPVVVLVWKAFRGGATPYASAVLLAGTFLATPHAFNYEMSLFVAAILWYLDERLRSAGSLRVLEIVVLFVALALPTAMLFVRGSGVPISFAPELALFALIVKYGRDLAAQPDPVAPLEFAPS